MGKAGSRARRSKGREAGKPAARPAVGCGGCKMRGWEHGAGESPFLGQAGGGCGAGGAFLAGRAAGTNVFPTWPRIPGSARSHGQDAPAATPAPAASFPQSRERGSACGGGCGTGPSWGAAGACGVASRGPVPRAPCAPWETTNRAVSVKIRTGSACGAGEGGRPERPWILGHGPASLAPIHPPPPCVRPSGLCGWRAQQPDWRRVTRSFGGLRSNAICPAP